MDNAPDGPENPGSADGDAGSLRWLKLLVATLLVVMIVGFIMLIVTLVTRLPAAPDLSLPEVITLPDGTEAEAFTATADWYAVVTKDGRILVYDRATGAPLRTIVVETGD